MNHTELLDHNMDVFYKSGINGDWTGFIICPSGYKGEFHEYTWWYEVSHKKSRTWYAKASNPDDKYLREFTAKDLYHQFVLQLMSERSDQNGYWDRKRVK